MKYKVVSRAYLPVFLIVFFSLLPKLALSQTALDFSGYIIETQPELGVSFRGEAVQTLDVEMIAGVKRSRPLRNDTFLINESTRSGFSTESTEANPCKLILADSRVKSCSPNYIISLDNTPNDPMIQHSWGLLNAPGLEMPSVWDSYQGSDQLVIAVIDTGVELNHPDLRDNIWTNANEIPNNGVDDDGNGYVDDTNGWNFFNNNNNANDDNGHGTHVAGIIAGRGNNGLGSVGVNWQAKVIPLKFLGSGGQGSVAGAIQAIDYLIRLSQAGVPVRVANNSWGGLGFSQPLLSAFARAYRAGLIMIAAAGNGGNDGVGDNNDSTPHYPSSFDLPNIVSVAAIQPNGQLAGFSNFGPNSVDVAAPGKDIVSTYIHGQYASLSGTSMASPFVTGLLGILALENPEMSSESIVNEFLRSTSSNSNLVNKIYGNNLANGRQMYAGIRKELPDKGGNLSGCHYDVSQVSYEDWSPGSQLIIQADEANFVEKALPFEFSLYGKKVNKLTVSPNGLVYFGDSRPLSFDYQISSDLLEPAFAVFQTDLLPTPSPYGVYWSQTSDSVLITWRARHFSARSFGEIGANLKIYSDGRLQLNYKLQDPGILDAIQDKFRVQLKGQNFSDLTQLTELLSLNEAGKLMLDLRPVCASKPKENPVTKFQPNQLRLGQLTKNGRIRNGRVSARKKMGVYVEGSSGSLADLKLNLGPVSCTSTVELSSQGSPILLSAQLPRKVMSVRNIKVTLNGLSKRARVLGSLAANSKQKRYISRADRKALKTVCKRVIKKLK